MKFQNAMLISLSACLWLACASNEPSKSGTIDYWAMKQGDCESVLSRPHAYSLSQISHCTKLWEMYRHVDDIPIKMRSMYAVAFSEVSHRSTDSYDKGVADAALARICIPRHPMGNNGQVREEIPEKLECTRISTSNVGGTTIASSNPFARLRATVTVHDVSARKLSEASAAYKKASSQRKRKAYGQAIRFYQEALSANPYYVAAKYDLACAYAITGDERAALRELEELYTWDDPEVEQRLVKARSDEDFESVRSNPNFKLLTGYVRVIILNGAGSIGENTVTGLKSKLETRNIPVANTGRSNRPELMPQIWYREGFEDYAHRIKDIMGSSKVSVSLNRDRKTEDDIIVVWGQPEAAQIGAGQSAPVVQGKRATGSENMLDDAVKGVGDARDSIDNAVDTGKKVTSF